MPAFTFTSKAAPFIACFLLLWLIAWAPRFAVAADEGGNSKVYQPEESDFSGTPFTEYGQFNEEAEEEAETKFFQYGRFFGASLGLGFEGVTGNRGLLYQGGFPMVDFKVHYWFDFNVALDLGFFVASHGYESSATGGNHIDVNMLHVGVNIKYYFDTKNLSAPISFANPFILAGVGAFNKTEASITANTSEADSAMAMNLGAGLEFAITPRQLYFQLEGKYYLVKFQDNYRTDFQTTRGISDLTGGFYTFSGNLLFTW